MRKAVAIVLSFILAINVAAFFSCLAFQLIQYKEEMRSVVRTLPDSALHKIVLTKKDFVLFRIEQHELKINGKMFDIARYTEDEDGVIVWCLPDNREDNLLAFLEDALCKEAKGKSTIPSSLLQFIALDYSVPENIFEFSGVGAHIPKNSHYSFSAILFVSHIKSPPPKSGQLLSEPILA